MGEDGSSGGPRGWHSRGYMPHCDSDRMAQHVTFHLRDGIPRDAVERMQDELKECGAEERSKEWRRRLEAMLDGCHGRCILKSPEMASMMQDSLLEFDEVRYRLFAWVVMPNHVHVLFQTLNGWQLGKVVASWKSFTGRRLSKAMGEEGFSLSSVWQREYWDRYVRDERHFHNAMSYIHQNPVKAGLVPRAEEWLWSSASMR